MMFYVESLVSTTQQKYLLNNARESHKKVANMLIWMCISPWDKVPTPKNQPKSDEWSHCSAKERVVEWDSFPIQNLLSTPSDLPQPALMTPPSHIPHHGLFVNRQEKKPKEQRCQALSVYPIIGPKPCFFPQHPPSTQPLSNHPSPLWLPRTLFITFHH